MTNISTILFRSTPFAFILGICVEACELVEILLKSKGTQTEKRELILADKSRQKINCTLWGVDATNFSICGTPVILIRSARVSCYLTF